MTINTLFKDLQPNSIGWQLAQPVPLAGSLHNQKISLTFDRHLPFNGNPLLLLVSSGEIENKSTQIFCQTILQISEDFFYISSQSSFCKSNVPRSFHLFHYLGSFSSEHAPVSHCPVWTVMPRNGVWPGQRRMYSVHFTVFYPTEQPVDAVALQI